MEDEGWEDGEGVEEGRARRGAGEGTHFSKVGL